MQNLFVIYFSTESGVNVRDNFLLCTAHWCGSHTGLSKIQSGNPPLVKDRIHAFVGACAEEKIFPEC